MRQAACFLQLWAILMITDLHIPHWSSGIFQRPCQRCLHPLFKFFAAGKPCWIKYHLLQFPLLFLSVDLVVDTFLLVSENPDHAACKLWNVKMSAVSDSFFLSFLSIPLQSVPSEFKTGPFAVLLLQHSSTPNDGLSALVCTLRRLQPVRGDESGSAACACACACAYFRHASCQCSTEEKNKIKAQTDAANYLWPLWNPPMCDEWDPLTWGDTSAACNFKLSHYDDKVKRFGSGEYSHQ